MRGRVEQPVELQQARCRDVVASNAIADAVHHRAPTNRTRRTEHEGRNRAIEVLDDSNGVAEEADDHVRLRLGSGRELNLDEVVPESHSRSILASNVLPEPRTRADVDACFCTHVPDNCSGILRDVRVRPGRSTATLWVVRQVEERSVPSTLLRGTRTGVEGGQRHAPLPVDHEPCGAASMSVPDVLHPGRPEGVDWVEVLEVRRGLGLCRDHRGGVPTAAVPQPPEPRLRSRCRVRGVRGHVRDLGRDRVDERIRVPQERLVQTVVVQLPQRVERSIRELVTACPGSMAVGFRSPVHAVQKPGHVPVDPVRKRPERIRRDQRRATEGAVVQPDASTERW